MNYPWGQSPSIVILPTSTDEGDLSNASTGHVCCLLTFMSTGWKDTAALQRKQSNLPSFVAFAILPPASQNAAVSLLNRCQKRMVYLPSKPQHARKTNCYSQHIIGPLNFQSVSGNVTQSYSSSSFDKSPLSQRVVPVSLFPLSVCGFWRWCSHLGHDDRPQLGIQCGNLLVLLLESFDGLCKPDDPWKQQNHSSDCKFRAWLRSWTVKMHLNFCSEICESFLPHNIPVGTNILEKKSSLLFVAFRSK